jgi:uncharacterized protein (TIGR04255 family)
MANPRDHLNRAPIVEALLDLRVRPREGGPTPGMKSAAEALRGDYPEVQEISKIEGQLLIDARSVATTHSSTPLGWQLKNATAGRVVRLAQDGFTFSQLRPYPSWDVFLAEARRLWASYASAVAPREISRLGLRYINRIDLPASASLEDRLEAPPPIPPQVPRTVQRFLTQVVVYDEGSSASATITQAMEQTQGPGVTPAVLLDIDVFRHGTWDSTDPRIWEAFGKFRALKNRIFFASLKEAAIKEYA